VKQMVAREKTPLRRPHRRVIEGKHSTDIRASVTFSVIAHTHALEEEEEEE